jgi:hypothetical protein
MPLDIYDINHPRLNLALRVEGPFEPARQRSVSVSGERLLRSKSLAAGDRVLLVACVVRNFTVYN